MGLLQKLYQRAIEGDQPCPSPSDPEFQAEFPTLWEFMTCTQVGDETRLPGKIQITSEGDEIRISLVDVQTSQVASSVGNAVMATMVALEHAATLDQLSWYCWTAKRSGRNGRKK